MKRPSAGPLIGWVVGLVVVLGLGYLLAALINLTGEVREQRQAEQARAGQRAELASDVDTLRSQLLALGQVPNTGPPAQPGPPGREGATGPPGRDGDPGADGLAFVGPAGAAGAPGGAGSPGAPGTTGQAGAAGSSGTAGGPGPAGADGAPGAAGEPGPSGPPGEQGPPPESFTFTDAAGREFTCTDEPPNDGAYQCRQTGGPGGP